MNVNKTMISTALLTAIFHETRKGNIELIEPFVLYIIFENNEIADDELIKSKLEKDFSFFNLPHAVLNLIINKLKKDNKIEQKDKKYYILDKSQKEIEEFRERMYEAKNDSQEVLTALQKYINETTTLKTNFNNIRESLASFLDKNGYIIYSNYNPVNIKQKNIDKIQFYIAKFIEKEYNEKSHIFDLLKNMIEGLLLSNVIYLQIDANSTRNLKKLDCYFDSPILLRLIGFKLKEDNISAKELVELLKSEGAKIKCFKHSFNEVQSILKKYIEDRNHVNTKTLEGLDCENYNDIELNQIYINLEDNFKENGIEIVDKPEYEKQNYKDNKYEDVIDEKKLKEILIDRYTNKQIKDQIIDNDIDSVSAIYRLRKGKRIQKLEDCNSIFITSNYDIRFSVRELLNINEKIEISPVIGDVDLTAIIWLRTLKQNPKLPQDKLIENARAAMKPTPLIIEEFNKSLEKIKKSNFIKDGSSLQSLIYTTHFSSQLMNEIEGDASKINPRMVANLYENAIKKSTLFENESKEQNKKNVMLQLQNAELTNKLLLKEKEKDNVINNINNKYDKKIDFYVKFISNATKYFIDFILISIFVILLYSTIFGDFIEIKNVKVIFIIKIIGLLISLYSIAGTFFDIPHFFSISKFAKKHVYTKMNPIISRVLRERQRKELDNIFKSIDNGKVNM